MVSTRALFLRPVLLPWGTCARPTLVPLVFVFGSAPAQPAARRTRRVLVDYHATYQLQLASHGTRCRSGADVATVAHPSRLTVRSPPSCRRNRRGNFVSAAYATLLAHGLWPGLYFGGGVYVRVRTYNVMSQLSDWKRAHMCTTRVLYKYNIISTTTYHGTYTCTAADIAVELEPQL
jgi:hypothetical protein